MQVIALQKGIGWKHIELNQVYEMRKFWIWDNKEYRVDVYFGRLCDKDNIPVVIMNVSEQGAGVKQVIDDNCDVWTNIFVRTTKDEGNDYYRYLVKHGFERVLSTR